mmetsp:Transcript_42482/g.101077  ORF Transcript_42482/g.101077 Transcript_42482/m.101077 type:complete len:308 (+) Transcript_42482:813-1736(+)
MRRRDLLEKVVNNRAVDPRLDENAGRDEFTRDARKPDDLLALEVPAEELQVVRLPLEVNLAAERVVERTPIERVRQPEKRPHQVHCREEQASVDVALLDHVRVPHLDSNLARAVLERIPLLQHPAVHLRDGPRGDRLVLKLVEKLLDLHSKRRENRRASVCVRVGRRVVAQPGEGRDDVRREQVWPHRQPLAELHKGASSVLERRNESIEPVLPQRRIPGRKRDHHGEDCEGREGEGEEHRPLYHDVRFEENRSVIVRVLVRIARRLGNLERWRRLLLLLRHQDVLQRDPIVVPSRQSTDRNESQPP